MKLIRISEGQEINTKTAGTLIIGKVTNKQSGGQEYKTYKPDSLPFEKIDKPYVSFTQEAISRIFYNSTSER